MNTTLPVSPAPLFCGPEPSRSSRQVHSKSSFACRPSVTGGIANHVIHCESGLEKKAAHYLLVHPQVEDLQEQAPVVRWVDAAGVPHRHTFDFKATLKDGYVLAVAVKPAAIAERQRLQEQLEFMAPQIGSWADGVLLITDAHLTRDVAHNVSRLYHARKEANPEHDAAIRALLARPGQASIGDLVAASGLEGRGYRAVVRLIANGEISLIGNARLGYSAPVTWNMAGNGEAA